MFTDNGKIFVRKAYRIPEASRTAKGSNLINLIEIEKGEKVTAIIAIDGFNDGEYLTMLTKNGIIKRTLLKEYEYQRKGGKIAINLDEGDKLIFVGHTDGKKDILITTVNGQGVRFNENRVTVVSRTARGVKAVELRNGDSVCGAVIVDNSKDFLTITEKGFGKRCAFDEFEARNRGTMGVIAHNLTEKTGKLVACAAVEDNDDIMIITTEGVVIRTGVNEIPRYKRSTSGVKVMRLDDGSSIANITVTQKENDEEKETVKEDGESPVTDKSPEFSETRDIENTSDETVNDSEEK